MHICKPSLEVGGTGTGEPLDSRFHERPCLRETKWRATDRAPDILLWPLYTSVGVHTHTYSWWEKASQLSQQICLEKKRQVNVVTQV